MWRKEGFTLIELMIVIAIIAIIAAIAIPNLLSGRMSANESSAVASLKLMTNAEATWLQQDVDGNGRKDNWTYDVSCLHRMMRADNTTKVAFIAIDLAKADLNPAAAASATFTGGPSIEDWTTITTTRNAKSGYWFGAMALDNLSSGSPAGVTYLVNEIGTVGGGILACHSSKFGFMAAPDAYGTSGINSFIVNQEGTVYANDTGAEANKWLTATGETRAWPTVNPAGQAGAGGRLWRVAD